MKTDMTTDRGTDRNHNDERIQKRYYEGQSNDILDARFERSTGTPQICAVDIDNHF